MDEAITPIEIGEWEALWKRRGRSRRQDFVDVFRRAGGRHFEVLGGLKMNVYISYDGRGET